MKNYQELLLRLSTHTATHRETVGRMRRLHDDISSWNNWARLKSMTANQFYYFYRATSSSLARSGSPTTRAG